MADFIKKTLITAFAGLFFTSFMGTTAFARELMVGGQAVGIQLSTAGVMVAEACEVQCGAEQKSPARDAGIKKGDYIIKADGEGVNKAAEVIETVERLSGAPVSLTVKRGERELDFSVEPVFSDDGSWAIGLWLRDGVGGIGTLTFLDPETGIYGALGHSVSDSESGSTMPISEGSITDAQIVSVNPGSCGRPGELNGCADFGKVLGSIDLNTDFGIYGQCYVSVGSCVLETGSITPGPATILSTINGRQVEEYNVEVNRIYRESDGVHAMLSVTDGALISRTGGIVQGMSGSPIIQNGRLVGAVTHVFVSDPTRGYAISIDDMLKAAGIFEEKAA